MNNDMKCPFCNKPLQPTLRQSDEYWCESYDCPRTNIEWVGSKKLWQELIRTRKALDVALCSLQDIAESDGDFITGSSTPLDEHEYADMMLKEIKRQMKIKTALEQKDVK